MSKDELKIKKIDDILSNSYKLERYILEIENNNNIPYDKKIEKKLVKRMDEFSKKYKNTKYFEFKRYLKIAGFTITTLILWNLGISTINKENFHRNEDKKEIVTLICNNIENVSGKINTFLFTPINIERKEK